MRFQLAFRAHNIHHLRADFTNQLRLFQAFLLFLFVKDRAERVIRVLNITAQRSDILHLLRRIPQQQGAIAHRRIGVAGRTRF
ncbi:hypothetical protein CUU45_10155 [Pectobacterium polaris]|nr:hypothetical protein [Pectobacterium polaris]MCA6956278.1 hypothetical protein [Pectobacterium polaris]MCL6359256.1 hypothetical protein [Pectobacterium polaris]MCU1797629.1 hypothetical protein [Pectobacterium polaris]